MMDQQLSDAELISALVDGQLPAPQLADVMAQLSASAQARETWDTFHLLGELLRAEPSRIGDADAQFLQRLRGRLAQTTPGCVQAVEATLTTLQHRPDHAANDGLWQRWGALAGVALLALLTWQGAHYLGGAQARAELAVAPLTALPDSATAVLLRSPEVDALLAAHRQFGLASELPMPSGFLRNATFEESRP